MVRRVLVATSGALLALAPCRPAVAAGLAQAGGGRPATAAPAETATLEPIECWWRTSTGAARVGELFTLVLTCAVVESVETTVAPDQSRLDPGVLQIPPFEVVRGTQAMDVRTGIRRFFQYEYALRYAGEDFGRDVGLPPLTINYRVQNRTTPDAALEGRQRQYILPALMIRIPSLVPAIANDIRDRPADTFRETEARRFRATLLRMIAGFLYLVGAVVVLSGLAPVVRRRTRRTPAAVEGASDQAILRRMSRELEEIRRRRGVEGWTDQLAAQALTALRVVATYDRGQPVTQVRGEGVQPSEGQIVVPRRWPRRGATLVFSSATSATPVTGAGTRRRMGATPGAANGEGGLAGGNGAGRLADLDPAIARFAGKTYGRDARGVEDADLDEALGVGVRVLARARRAHAWPAKTGRAVAAGLDRLTGGATRSSARPGDRS